MSTRRDDRRASFTASKDKISPIAAKFGAEISGLSNTELRIHGELVFRTNEKITWEDGVYSFADIRKPDGTLVPLSAKIRKSMTPATR